MGAHSLSDGSKLSQKTGKAGLTSTPQAVNHLDRADPPVAAMPVLHQMHHAKGSQLSENKVKTTA